MPTWIACPLLEVRMQIMKFTNGELVSHWGIARRPRASGYTLPLSVVCWKQSERMQRSYMLAACSLQFRPAIEVIRRLLCCAAQAAALVSWLLTTLPARRPTAPYMAHM